MEYKNKKDDAEIEILLPHANSKDFLVVSPSTEGSPRIYFAFTLENDEPRPLSIMELDAKKSLGSFAWKDALVNGSGTTFVLATQGIRQYRSLLDNSVQNTFPGNKIQNAIQSLAQPTRDEVIAKRKELEDTYLEEFSQTRTARCNDVYVIKPARFEGGSEPAFWLFQKSGDEFLPAKEKNVGKGMREYEIRRFIGGIVSEEQPQARSILLYTDKKVKLSVSLANRKTVKMSDTEKVSARDKAKTLNNLHSKGRI